MAGHETPQLEILVAFCTLGDGGRLVFPVAAPQLAVYELEDDPREELRRGLAKQLPALAPEVLAGVLARRGELLEVEVELDLRSRETGRGGSLRLVYPCLVTSSDNDRWVTLLRLGHSFHASAREDLPALAAAEILRILKARIAAGETPLELLPPLETTLELIPIRLGPAPLKQNKKGQRAADLALLAEVGSLFAPNARGLLPRPLEEARLAPLLSGKSRGSFLVVGEPGVGKSALLQRVLAGRPEVYLTSGYQWIAGQSLFGQLEERVQQVMAAAQRVGATFYFERFDELLTSRGQGDDLLSLFRRFVVAEKVAIVGELAADRLDEAQRSHASFFAALTVVRVEPLDRDSTREILLGRLAAFLPDEKSANLRSELAAALLELAERYFPDRPLPGLAVSLLGELAARAEEARRHGEELQLADLYRLVARRTGIPDFLLREDVALRGEKLREIFRAGLVGQEEAVEQLVGTLCAVKARLQPEGKPLAVLLFVGPTGVGKTEAARCLARLLFGDEGRLIRFDMSEYSDPYAAERLIRGNDREEGLLTRQVRRQPFAVVLLDEIEKADGAVFDLLLQVAGEGRLSDARGRTASFHNVILVMTSNLGATERRTSGLGFGGPGAAPNAAKFYQAQVEAFFRPELVNRLDRVIPFAPLERDELGKITRLQLAKIARRRGFSERGLELRIGEAVVERLARLGFAPAHGARRLRRELQKRLIAPAAALISREPVAAMGAQLRVELAEEAARLPAPHRREKAGELLFDLHQASASPFRGELSGLENLQNFRRTLRRLLAGATVQELAEEILLHRRRLFENQLRQQRLAKEGRRKGGDSSREIGLLVAESARLEQRRHQLEQVYAPLLQLKEEVEDAEELAFAEFLADREASPMARALEDWQKRLRQALAPALLVLDQGPLLTLLLTEADDQRAFERWLRPLLAALRRDGGGIGGWPLGEKTRLEEGARLDLGGLESWLGTRSRERQLLLEVGEPRWASRLFWEGGQHHFEDLGDRAASSLLVVDRVLRGRTSLEQREKIRKSHLLRPVQKGEEAPRPPLLRHWRIEGDHWWPRRAGADDDNTQRLLSWGGLVPFPIPAGDYWTRQLELLGIELAADELSGQNLRYSELGRLLIGGQP